MLTLVHVPIPVENAPTADFSTIGNKLLSFTYVNHEGKTADRRVAVLRIFYGVELPYYPEPQWLLEAYDLDRQQRRVFSMRESKMTRVRPLGEV